MNVDEVGGKTSDGKDAVEWVGSGGRWGVWVGRGRGGQLRMGLSAGSGEGVQGTVCLDGAGVMAGSGMRRAPALDGTEAEGGVERMDGNAGRV